jgi:hypothetical protein
MIRQRDVAGDGWKGKKFTAKRRVPGENNPAKTMIFR